MVDRVSTVSARLAVRLRQRDGARRCGRSVLGQVYPLPLCGLPLARGRTLLQHPASLILLALGLAACTAPRGPEAVSGPTASAVVSAGPVTRAEATDYRETSTYADVVAFLDALDPDAVHQTTFGKTVEGRALPLAVWGAPSASAADVRATGKTRVLVFATIHGGEVAGKEAALVLLRDLANGKHAAWADSLVVLVAPLYNADGNERVAYDNRPLQLGPVGGMGERTNAQGLDLNRDFTKLAAPESRALVGLMRSYDPHVVLDLHTTDGTLMGYGLTYAPPLSPNTPAAIDRDLRERLLPAVTDSLMDDGLATYHYGNVPGAFGEATDAPRGWYSFSAQPRFSTNYVGLRGRYGILSEAYSYATFEDRVRDTRRFVEEVLDQVWAHASRVRRVAAEADRQSVVGQRLAVRAEFAALPRPVEVLLGEADTVAHPTTGAPMLRRRGVRRSEAMPAFVRFRAAETVEAPARYVVHFGPHQENVRALLDAHGVEYASEYVWGVARQRFQIDSLVVAERPFQGVRQQEVFGEWTDVPAEAGPPPRLAPALVVPVDQPLGRLVVALLEPRSDDGVVAWGVVGPDALQPGRAAPVERVPER